MQARRTEPARNPPPSLGLLLVDDEPEALEEMNAALEIFGIHGELASNGVLALQALEKNSSLGIVVTDLRMPEMSGFEMIESIRKSRILRDRELRFVVVTGHGDLAGARRAMVSGAIDFIPKPADPAAISEAVRRAQGQLLAIWNARRKERVRARWAERAALRNRRLRERVFSLGASLIKRMAEQNDGRTSLMRRMSHEFRTPIHQILGLIELLQTDGAASDPEYVALIERAAKDLLSLVDGLLDLKNADELSAVPRMAVDVKTLIQNCCADTAHLAAGRSVKVTVHAAQDVGSVEVDRKFATGALRNVLSNAVQFSPNSGEVVIRASHADGGVELSVADAGVGMSDEEVANATQAFWQADRSMSRKHGGLGLGLTLASLYLDLLGGNLTIDSNPGHGTRVTLKIPVM